MYIVEKTNKRWCVIQRELTCGSPIDVFDVKLNKWVSGAIEHDEIMYFFIGDDGKRRSLSESLEVRLS